MYMRGCESGQYSTLTRAHTHLNLWVLPGPVFRPTKMRFYPIHYGYFSKISIESGSNCHPYKRRNCMSILLKSILLSST